MSSIALEFNNEATGRVISTKIDSSIFIVEEKNE